jgi:hypothetical protein
MRGGALILFPQILSLFFGLWNQKKLRKFGIFFFLIVNSTLVFVGEEFISKN